MSWSLPRGTRIERFWNNQAKKFYSATKTADRPTDKVLPSGRFFRVTAEMFDSNYAKRDPNFKRSAPYLVTVPRDEGYPDQMAGGKTIGQAWGTFEWAADFTESGYLDAVSSNTGMLRSPEPPYLRPLENGVPSEVVFDFYCPFVLVDGVFSGKLAAGPKDQVSLELRCLDPKPDSRDEPDRWSEWREIASGHGPFEATVGRESYAPGKDTVHGKYRFQLRVKAYAAPDPRGAGLEALKFKCYFENGIMSIPRLTPGKNTITFKVSDQEALKAPITVTYRYETPGGEKTHRQTLNPRDFSGNRAAYIIDVPDLMRSNSLTIEY